MEHQNENIDNAQMLENTQRQSATATVPVTPPANAAEATHPKAAHWCKLSLNALTAPFAMTATSTRQSIVTAALQLEPPAHGC